MISLKKKKKRNEDKIGILNKSYFLKKKEKLIFHKTTNFIFQFQLVEIFRLTKINNSLIIDFIFL